MRQFCCEKKPITGNFDANLILRQNKLEVMARFMEIKSFNPKLKEQKIAKELGYSYSKLKQKRNGMIMDRLYKLMGPKGAQMSPNEHKRPQKTSKESPSVIEPGKKVDSASHIRSTDKNKELGIDS